MAVEQRRSDLVHQLTAAAHGLCKAPGLAGGEVEVRLHNVRSAIAISWGGSVVSRWQCDRDRNTSTANLADLSQRPGGAMNGLDEVKDPGHHYTAAAVAFPAPCVTTSSSADGSGSICLRTMAKRTPKHTSRISSAAINAHAAPLRP